MSASVVWFLVTFAAWTGVVVLTLRWWRSIRDDDVEYERWVWRVRNQHAEQVYDWALDEVEDHANNGEKKP